VADLRNEVILPGFLLFFFSIFTPFASSFSPAFSSCVAWRSSQASPPHFPLPSESRQFLSLPTVKDCLPPCHFCSLETTVLQDQEYLSNSPPLKILLVHFSALSARFIPFWKDGFPTRGTLPTLFSFQAYPETVFFFFPFISWTHGFIGGEAFPPPDSFLHRVQARELSRRSLRKPVPPPY